MKDIKKRLSDIPSLPGVYFFKDIKGRIIYIGKAVDLKARVKSYFIKNSLYGIKVAMLTEIAKIDYKTTDTGIDALILESQLIKKHRPKYNILLKDDKNYFYVVFTSEQFPKIFITHQPHKFDKARGISHKKTLNFPSEKISFTARFRSGSPSEPTVPAQTRNTFFSKMPRASDNIILGPYTDGQALKITLRYLRRIFPYCTCKNQHKIPCLKSHLGLCLGVCCAYPTNNLQPITYNKEIKIYKKNIKSIIDILSGKRKSILKKLKKEMKTAVKNEDFENAVKLRDKISALENIFQHKIAENASPILPRIDALRWEGAKSELRKIFRKKIERIEFYDISNISGQLAAGSMAVFDNGKIDKNQYRKFKIKALLKIDDPAMMREVLKRRLKHKEWSLPDLIIVDGGIAQLNIARKILKNTKILCASLAKNPDRLFSPPHFKTPYNSIKTQYFLKRRGGESSIKQIALKDLSENMRLFLQNLRDEAHRFAINYHKKLRSKKLKEEFMFRRKKTADF